MKFEDLDVWKRSARLSANIYKTLQMCKVFSFRDQITRAGLSTPSNYLVPLTYYFHGHPQRRRPLQDFKAAVG